jgi:hypothetical protein
MTWLMWQQYRKQLYWIAGAVAAAALFLLLTGLHLQHLYHSAFHSCSSSPSGCGALTSGAVFPGDSRMFDIVLATGFLVPFVLALFWGVPLVTRDFEEGTHRMVWTQSVTRLRWLGVRAGWAALGAVAVTGILGLLINWWYRPVNAVQLDRLGSAVFDAQGLVPVTYAICALALGLAAGVLLRRTVPAMAATVFVFGLTRYVVDSFLRPNLLAPRHVLAPLVGQTALPRGGLGISQKIVDAAGRGVALLDGSVAPATLPSACRDLTGNRLGACLDASGYHRLISYLPANRFWELQGVEGSLYLAAAAFLVSFAFWWVARRDA